MHKSGAIQRWTNTRTIGAKASAFARGFVVAAGLFFVFMTAGISASLTPAVNAPLLSMAGGTAPSAIWASAAGASITTTADTSCFSATGSGPGQTITPSTAPVAPYQYNTFTMTCEGVYTSPAIGTVGIVSKIKWGSVTVATATSPGLSASSSNTLQWTAWGKCTVQTANNGTANSSTVSCWGQFTYMQGAGATSLAPIITPFQSTSPVTVDTSAAFKIDLTLALVSSLGTESLTGIGGLVKIEF